MTRHSIQFGVAFFVLTATISCRYQPTDSSGASGLESQSGEAKPLTRLYFEDADGNPRPDTLVYVARQYHRSSSPLPYRSGERKLLVGHDGAIALGEMADLDAVSPEASGIAYAFYDSFNGPSYGVFQFEPNKPPTAHADARVAVQPNTQLARPWIPEPTVHAWTREVLPLPYERRTAPLRIPENGKLFFSAMPEFLAEGIKVHNNPAAQKPPGEDSEIAIQVRLETDSESVEVYRAAIESPSIWNEPGIGRLVEPLAHFHEADLSAFAGQAARLHFRIEESDPSGETLTTASWILASMYVLGDSAPSEASPNNLIMISLDTLRADRLGCYGYARDTSPHLDAFAAESILFERCMASAAWTTASHGTVFTGLPTSIHRADGFSHSRIRDQFTTLGEVAASENYLTAAYTEGIAMSGGRGFNQGFDLYSDGYGAPIPLESAEKTFARGKAWLDRFGDTPFFLYLHTYQIHAPYQAPEPYREKFAPGAPASIEPLRAGMTELTRRQTSDMYDAEIAYTDEMLGDFLTYLRENGYLENTMIVIFSDHGEEFWEHGGVSHGKTLYQEQLHVPLIIRPAGRAESGHRIDRLVGLTDLFATIVEGMKWNADIPETSMSLYPFLSNPAYEGYDRKLIASAQRSGQHSAYRFAVQTPDRKYIVSAKYNEPNCPIQLVDRKPFMEIEMPLVEYLMNQPPAAGTSPVMEELFDLHTDPGEQSNRARVNADELRAARERLNAYIHGIADHPLLAPTLPDESQPLTTQEIEDLRALGYLE